MVFMGGDLNGFWDIRNFKNCLGIPPGQPMSLKFQILNFVEYFLHQYISYKNQTNPFSG